MLKKILIVDDSAIARQEAIRALDGFESLEARDGMEGAELIEQRADLDLVVCDVNMPRMNGLEMLARVRGREANSKLKVVVLTTEGQPEMIREAKKLGAAGWLVKPFNPNQLRAVAKKLTDSSDVDKASVES